ncbi:MAG: hypothetical protein R3B13_31960 [Polyangiaceae bacterium]
MFDLKDPSLSEADRESIRRLTASSRQRWLQAAKAHAIAIPLTIVASGLPSVLIMWLTTEWEFAALCATPGLALGWSVYQRMHPDHQRR